MFLPSSVWRCLERFIFCVSLEIIYKMRYRCDLSVLEFYVHVNQNWNMYNNLGLFLSKSKDWKQCPFRHTEFEICLTFEHFLADDRWNIFIASIFRKVRKCT